MSKVAQAAIACRANLRSRKARSLFISGPATAACEAGDSSSTRTRPAQHGVADGGGDAPAHGLVG